MNREEFIGKLQMVYVGDRNAFNEIVEDNQKLKNELVYSKVEIDRLNNIIDGIENTIENFMENHTEGYIDWKYDREIYLAERNVLQKLYDTYFDKLKALKENNK